MKIGDTVRIKTIKELEEAGIDWKRWEEEYKDIIGKECVVSYVSDNNSIRVNDLLDYFFPNEYVLFDNELKCGDIVYVSDESEEGAEKQKQERIFLAYVPELKCPYLCVNHFHEDNFYNRDYVGVVGFTYAVKNPIVKKKLTKKELISYLEEHGLELED